ncbi:MAG: insulinase family protein, partial [Schleiferiaceae bacterium]|nr:insulinase family protein [Schleiferiaceae bacterium]
PSGIRVIHKPTNAEVSHCGLMVLAGSRDEQEDEQGLAHFIEHSLFKGTKKRRAFHILSRLDEVGGELNAFTSKEETFIYGSFLNTYYNRAIDLIFDITFQSKFPAKEIEKEKDVILDEILTYLDSPSEAIFDDFEDLLFEGHTLGRNILGTKESLKRFDRDMILGFIDRLYQPENMVFCSVGNISEKKLRRSLEKADQMAQSRTKVDVRNPINLYKPQALRFKKSNFQSHVILGNRACSMHAKDLVAYTMLNNILGGPGLNSRLNLNIREKYGFAYSLESFLQPFSDTGVFGVYVGTDENTLNKAQKLIKTELKKLTREKLGVLQLSKAKKQLIGQLALGQESKINQLISLGKARLNFETIETLEEVHKKIEAVTADKLVEVAEVLFDPNQLSTLIYTPGE